MKLANQNGKRADTNRGMTLIEVLIALTIMSISILALASYITRFTRDSSESYMREVANELASTRIEEIKGAGNYRKLDSLFGGTEVYTAGRYKGFERETILLRTGGGETDLFDYTTVTVLIRSSYFPTPVSKTSIIAAY